VAHSFRVRAAVIAACWLAVLVQGLVLGPVRGQFLAAAPQRAGSRDALWIIVHDQCVPDELQRHDPRPCAQVDLSAGVEKGFAVLKDIRGATQFLLISTGRISGIESPILLSPDEPNYFADAWEARRYIDEALHRMLPRDEIGLAINSAFSRSQDQLHIHVDCVRPDVREALREHGNAIGDRWADLDVSFSGHRYKAMWVSGEHLGSNNPFRLLAEGVPGASRRMGEQTLVVTGAFRANGDPGFVILEDQVTREKHDSASGEELLDHSCRIASGAQEKN
jgi:CDP-diacylglycerol pyrophosphatase